MTATSSHDPHSCHCGDRFAYGLGGEFLLHNNIGGCREGTDMVTYILRSLGIPAATDSYRYSPDAYLGHGWNVFMDTTGLFLPTEYGRATTQRDWNNHCSKGKVYRGKEDVTDMYFPANKAKLPHLGRSKKGGFAGVFSIDGWIPIGTYKRNLVRRACVKNIETEQVYPASGRAIFRPGTGQARDPCPSRPRCPANSHRIPAHLDFLWK